ncbi:MAG: diguanylate cyclase [Aestuariivirga sp.]|uniref:GGDEF domain-containing protein n=1 Tax=Aestuariivirga sp. TaxID=2650926 RepID=UPI0038D10EE1
MTARSRVNNTCVYAPAMNSKLRILLAVVSGLTGLGALYLIQAPDQLAYSQALELGAVTLLLAATLVSIAWDALRKPDEPAGTPAGTQLLSPEAMTPPGVLTSDDQTIVQTEVAKLLLLLRQHADANENFSVALDRAKENLHESLKAEQVRIIISYLMIENEKMKARTANLQANLENSQRQIERLKTNLATAEAQGVSDPLTGLKNRRGFDVILSAQVAASRSGNQPLSLILADIDHFKAINDRYGHPAGDDVLRWFSRILSSNVKGRDTVARYGGEEFAVILPATPLENALKVAAHIKAQLEQQVWQKPGAPNTLLRVTASFGVAQLNEGEGTSGLVTRADSKLYEAKTGGRNRVAA